VEYRNLAGARLAAFASASSTRRLSLQYAPDLAVGLYIPIRHWSAPAGSGTGPSFTVSESEKYKVTCSGDARQILSSFASTDRGLPHSVSVRADFDQSVGVSYFPQRHERAEEYGGTATASLAIDFGTTKHGHLPATSGAAADPRRPRVPKTHGLNPRDIAPCALWLADNESWRNADVIADFLPGPGYRRNATDPYVIPSEVWRIGARGISSRQMEHHSSWSTGPADGQSVQVG